MKYYLDTEFLEGTQKEKFPISLFRKNTPPTIDLISIGIVAEDSSEYYAVSKDFNLKEAWNRYDWKHDLGSEPRKVYWIRENVLKPIFDDLNTDHAYPFEHKFLKRLISKHGKTNKEIADEIVSFTTKAVFKESKCGKYLMGSDSYDKTTKGNFEWDKPEFYAYYADYDWVVFCWVFGKMMDLPKGFPKYCRDLKQMFDEIQTEIKNNVPDEFLCVDLKVHPGYPKQENEHSAIHDARWNKKLHEFLNTL